MPSVLDTPIRTNAPISTWYGVGGAADRLARPEDIDQLRRCADSRDELRLLGEGANLLVDDEGVDGIVALLDRPAFTGVDMDADSGRVRVGAGASLQKLIGLTVRAGLAGIEGLAGVPATVGGAVVMNAGGTFGEIADVVLSVELIERGGALVTRAREDVEFSYRHSGLEGTVIIGAELQLERADPELLRSRWKQVMASKARTQPLAERSGGCAFRNPTLPHSIEGVGERGERVSAGRLIDLAGCKGLSRGSASVSDIHANFILARRGGRARDVIELMDEVRRRVEDRFGVSLQNEVVIWRRKG